MHTIQGALSPGAARPISTHAGLVGDECAVDIVVDRGFILRRSMTVATGTVSTVTPSLASRFPTRHFRSQATNPRAGGRGGPWPVCNSSGSKAVATQAAAWRRETGAISARWWRHHVRCL